MKDVMGTVTEIISLVKYSPKRENLLENIKDLPLMKLWDLEVKARIIGVQNQMCKFQFFYGLNVSQWLFAISDNLSKTLQKESMSALKGLCVIENRESLIRELSKELFFNNDDVFQRLCYITINI